MAAAPCIPSATTSAFMERFANAKPEVTVEVGRPADSGLENRLAAFIHRLNSDAAFNIPLCVSSEHLDNQKSNQEICYSGVGNDISLSPNISADSANTVLGLSQAQQLVILLSNLACQNPCLKSSVITTTSSRATESTLTSGKLQDNPPSASQNILHQLLCGADIKQVRHRSELIEPTSNLLQESPSSITGIPENVASTIVNKVMKTPVLTKPTEVNGTCNPKISHSQPTPTGGLFEPAHCATQWMTPMWQLPTSMAYPDVEDALTLQPSIVPSFTFTEQLLSILAEIEKANQTTKPSHILPGSTSISEMQKRSDPVGPSISFPYPLRLHRLLTTTVSDPPENAFTRVVQSASTISQETIPRSSGSIPNSNNAHTSTATIHCSSLPASNLDNSFPALDVPLSRPRCYSDLHYRMDYRHKLYRSHRPRSHSKVEHSRRPTTTKSEAENLAKELESSLFAQLVLKSDSPSPTTIKPEPSDEFEADRQKPSSESDSKPSSDRTAQNFNHVSSGLMCSSQIRGRIFEWLREADLFVAEHCCDIPLGALLAAAISPGRSGLSELCATFVTPSASEPIPTTARRAVAKSWHQFLLIALMENNFIPQLSTNTHLRRDDIVNHADHASSSTQEKLLKAIASLAALENEDSAPPDWFLLSDLTSLVSTARELQLDSNVYRSMRFCILAQSAYPRHFSTSYLEALSELEARISKSPVNSCSFVEVLKIMNRLHCFDSGTLKQFFCLASDLSSDSVRTRFSPLHSDRSSPSKLVTTTIESAGCGAFKRKACYASSTHVNLDRDSSPVHMRSRAYTTNSYNKSARLSGFSGTRSNTGRNRSDTMPSVHRN